MLNYDLSRRDMLNYAIENGIINLSYVQDMIEMKKRKDILKQHPYKIWEGNDGKWYTYVLDEDGKRVKKKRTSQSKIEDFLIEYYTEIERKEKRKNEENKKSEYQFKSYFDLWVKKQISYGVSNNTVSKYESDYKRFFKDTNFETMDIREITEEDITACVISNIKKYNLKEKAGKALLGYISGVFHSALLKRKIQENPCIYVDRKIFFKFYNKTITPQEKRVVSNKEIKELLDIIKRDHMKEPEYIPSYAVELSMFTGMRVGELAGLRWDRILYDKRIIVIDQSEKYDRKNKRYYVDATKTHKIRYFPLTDILISFFRNLHRVQMEYGYITEFVFSNEGGRVHGRVISDWIRNKCIQAGMDIKRISSMRRTVNSKMKCMGVSSAVAASIMGHTEEVNESNYTYDITGMDYKLDIVSKINEEIKNIG